MAEQPSFSYPIPGEGMTSEVGSRPWQNPPKYKTVEEALDFYIPRLTSDEVYDALLDSMELGIPLTTMADSMQSIAVMQGLHTIDVGILAIPVIVEMLAFIGDNAGIEYTLGTESAIDEDTISESKIALAMKKMRERLPKAIDDIKVDDEPAMPVEETVDNDEPQPSGLMARRM